MPLFDRFRRQQTLYEAVVAAKAAVLAMRDALAASERALAAEEAERATAERRTGLARGIDDHETVAVGERAAERHRERAAVLAQKVAAQRAELALAEREVAEMAAELRRAGHPEPPSAAAAEARLEDDLDLDGAARAAAERRARMAEAVDAQLAALKRKLGKESS